MARIFYMSANFSQPSGGVRTIFRHVRLLRDMGWDAVVVAPENEPGPPTWFREDVPVVSPKNGLRVNREDVVVVPEIGEAMVKAIQNTKFRKVLFCQNHFFVFRGLGKHFKGWREAGFDHALYCSETVRTAVERCFTFESSAVIRCVVPRDTFKPRPKRPCVVFMVRERPTSDVEVIRAAFERLWPQYAELLWVGMKNTTEARVAETLGEASVFLSLAYREGLGLPALEAMSAGCLVAGFTGLGGQAYATPDNGFWVPEEDMFAAADAVGRALHTALSDPARTRAMQQAGAETVAAYSEEGMREDLRAFWTDLVGPPAALSSNRMGADAVSAMPAEARGPSPRTRQATPAGSPFQGHDAAAPTRRVLVAVPHFFGKTDATPFGSTQGKAAPRVQALASQIRSLKQAFGPDHGWLDIVNKTIEPANTRLRTQVDVVIHTVADHHVLDHFEPIAHLFEHCQVDVPPMRLGFACHRTLAERVDDYDMVAFFEDDLVINDPLFFEKVAWFTMIAGDQAVLLPNRYEIWPHRPPRRLYVDGDIRQAFLRTVGPMKEGPPLEARLLGQVFGFQIPVNPHSGCFVLTRGQMRQWMAASYFLDQDVRFVGPLESAATLGLIKTFRIYKPVWANAAFLEVQHAAMRFRPLAENSFANRVGGGAVAEGRPSSDPAASAPKAVEVP